MRWSSLRSILAFSLISCVRPPLASPPEVAAPAPAKEMSVKFQEDPTLDGLRLELYDATPAAGDTARLPTPATSELTDAEVDKLLARLPALEGAATDAVPFALRQGPTPRPRTGTTEKLSFPAGLDVAAPEVPTGPVTVLRHAPDGDVPMAPHLSVTFSRPMIPLTSADEAAAMVPMTLTPTPKGAWRWLGTKTLMFAPEPRFPMATTYTAEIPAGTKAADGSVVETATKWTFSTPPITLKERSPAEYAGPQKLQPLLYMAFDQAITPDKVLPYVEIERTDVLPRLATADEIAADPAIAAMVAKNPERSMVAIPSAPLQNATTYNVVVKAGAPSAEGPLPSKKDQSFRFTTYGRLTLAPPTCWQTPCPPDANWSIAATNPLNTDFDASTITVEPKVPGLVVMAGGSYINVSGAFTPRSTYTVRAAAGIRDVFGQATKEPYTWTIDVGPADKSFQGPDQPFVTADPAGKPAVSVYSTNHASLKVQIRRVTPLHWSPWTQWWSRYRWEDARKGQLPGTSLFSGTVKVASDPDRQVETAIDLAPYLKGEAGHFIVQVEPTVQPKDRWARSEWVGWVQVTKMGITTFVAHGAVTTWVTELADGKPVAGATVSLLGADGSAKSDTSGLARLNLTSALGALAVRGDDTAFLPVQPYGYEGTWNGWNPSPQARVLVFDDKHLYKPKETVHVRGWVRTAEVGPETKLVANKAKTVKWTARSSLGNPIGEGTTKVAGLGGFTFDIPLAATPDLGTAQVILEIDGEPGTYTVHTFEIQEYRTPEFEVTASGADGVYTLGEDAIVDVSAAYYAGGGLPAAPVTWSVTSTPGAFSPPGREDWSFGAWSPWWRWWTDPESYRAPDQHTSVTDALGVHHLGIHFAALNPARPMSVTAEASVMDTNRQAWAASRSFLVHPAEWYVGVRTAKPYVAAKSPVNVQAVVVDRAGAVVGGKATVSFRRLTWKQVNGSWSEVPDEISSTTVEGEGKATFTPDVGGSYSILASVVDPHGRRNETDVRVWVAGAAVTPDRGVTQERVTLLPEKKSWRVGETAAFAVQAPFTPAEGVLTVRVGGEILETRTFRVDDGVVPLEVKVTEQHVPDFTVAVDLVGAKERSGDDGLPDPKLPKRVAYAGGSLTFDVSRETRTLGVTVKPTEARLVPGGKTDIDVVVTGPDGKPAAGAELAVIAVDEAVLALTGYSLPDPLVVFYGPRGDAVSSYHLRQWITLLNPTRLPTGGLGASGYGVGGGGFGSRGRGDASVELAAASTGAAMEAPMADAPAPPPPGAPVARMNKEAKADKLGDSGGGEAGPAIAVRSNFSAVALWAPSVTTDASGKARVPLALPDSLTRYRVMVVAVAGDRTFGSGTADVTARLPLMVRPSPPRFLNFGDRAELPVVLQNQTDAPMTVDVALRTTNLGVVPSIAESLTPGTVVRDRAGRRLTVPANDRVEVRFPVAAKLAGTARFQLAASSGAYADAATGELPVWTPATTEAFATYGTMGDDGALTQPLSPPKDVWPQYGGIEVTVSSTQLQALTDAFLYLQTYKYECNEQLASRVMSVAALRDVLTAFEAPDLPSPEVIDATMKADLDHLARRQNPDGGWAFWRKNDESWPYLGVHITHTLVRARDAKMPVDPGTLARALQYTRTIEAHIPHWYSRESKWAIRAYAISVMSLAGEPQVGKAQALFAEAGADKLGAESLGWILPTLHNAKSKEAATIWAWLGNHVTESAAGAHFVTSYSDGAHVLLHSDRVADGVVLEAMLRTKPKDDLVPKLVNGLLAHRTAGRWQSTTENAHILLAMRRYFKEYEGVTPAFLTRVWLGEGLAGEKSFAGYSTESAQIDVPMAYLQDNPGDVTISKEGAGRLYYRMGLRYAPVDLDVEASDRGFSVSRRYEGVDDPTDVTRDVEGTWTIKAGARVRVRLEMVTPMRRYHVALVDPLPAGLEVMNPELAVTGAIPADPSAQPAYWWWSRAWYDHENLRDERVEAFASLLYDGVHSYTYVARATTPGDFVVPPAKAEEMYSPETFGRSGGDRVIVR
jgi:uncharacterized protein YfaS (alpha-2-macroglobulin family)